MQRKIILAAILMLLATVSFASPAFLEDSGYEAKKPHLQRRQSTMFSGAMKTLKSAGAKITHQDPARSLGRDAAKNAKLTPEQRAAMFRSVGVDASRKTAGSGAQASAQTGARKTTAESGARTSAQTGAQKTTAESGARATAQTGARKTAETGARTGGPAVRNAAAAPFPLADFKTSKVGFGNNKKTYFVAGGFATAVASSKFTDNPK